MKYSEDDTDIMACIVMKVVEKSEVILLLLVSIYNCRPNIRIQNL